MISLFLHSIAAQVRALVSEGKALHVSEKTADELELVAGLFEKDVPLIVVSEVVTRAGNATQRDGVARPIAPSDIAWAWLKLSQAPVVRFRANNGQEIDCADVESTKRAAECAELAVLSSNGRVVWPKVDVHSDGGTCEGARAAWGHIANELKLEHYLSADDRRGGKTGMRQNMAAMITQTSNRYRRELEAM